MQRRIVEPADVSGAALAELKSWLGITRPNEDELLIDLLHTSLSMCESFTGQIPIWQLIEEKLPIQVGRYTLTSRPISSISKLELEDQSGVRTELAAAQFYTQIQSGGMLCVRTLNDHEGQAIVATVRAGISESWEQAPATLKQGIIRLCAYQYRDRDRPGGDTKMASPPASVSALWRPWQTLRLS